uniref:Uncharacterized protein At4g10930 n=1 Tax=Anthurium amnicola TaxID=1678845 RepID=A0A1D1XHX8_9ARAE
MEAMDLGDDAEDVSGDAVAGLDDVLDDAAFENEACGICMDTVIDRGVLDCCSHWFCFACIDNWATITSLCPICKKEFQLITCLPVYDTISNFKVDEHLLSRGDDWYIQGKNNTLSFPSYYINEDAVICLDGDGCKIRSKLSTEEDLIFDTSIACDSCDIWYHAFCVGFDPECTLENSWLCPRCVDDALPQNLDNNSVQNPIDHYDPTNAGSGQSVDSAFSGKVSISIADAGETAVVVSMLEGTQLTRSAERGQVESELATNTGVAMEAVMANIDTCNTEFEQCVYRNCVDDGDDRSAAGDQGHFEFPLGLSSERSIISSNSLVQESFSGSSPSIEALTDRPATPSNDSELGMSFGLSVSEGGPSVCDVAKVQAVGDSAQHSNDVFSLSADKFIKNGDENVAPLPNHKNVSGHTEILSSQLMKDSYTSGQLKKRGRDSHAKPATEVCSTKDKLDERFHMVPQRRRIDTSVAMIPEGFSGMTSPKDSELKHASEMENRTSDIMTIVQDDREFSKKRLSDERNSQKSTNVRQSGVGLRMKKIMWRVGDDKESSLLVQKLRNEIRETVCGKELSDFSQDGAFDGELLSAFRAAIAKPTNKPVGKVDSSLARGKKHLLQKGKVRENLSKKIYGTASGRRRRAWDRDRVVEFWKHRCTSIKPEKVETLQSVLDLLKKIKSSHVNCEIEQGFEMEATNSILSRVYLADTSVLPRQEDIKPLSALTGHFMVSTLEHQNLDKFSSSLDTNLSKNIVRTDDKSSSDSSQGVVALYDKKVMIDGSNFMMGGRSCISAPRHSEGGEKTLKEPLVCSGSARCDKRNWALEVLARKNALTSRETSQRNEEDNSLLKETYPLLVC